MALDPLMKNAMEGPYFVTALLFDIILPDRNVRLLDGVGEVYYGGNVYRGSDDVFGSVAAIDPLQEQIGTEAPFLRMKLLPQDRFALAYLTDPARQGCAINLLWATIDPATGLIIGEPLTVFAGSLDAAEADIDQNDTTITIDIASAWDLLFMNQQGMRLSNAQHTKTWSERAAEERGFEFVTSIQREEPWGYDQPRPAVVADVIGGQPRSSGGGTGAGGGSSGGGGGGGGFSGGGGYVGGRGNEVQAY